MLSAGLKGLRRPSGSAHGCGSELRQVQSAPGPMPPSPGYPRSAGSCKAPKDGGPQSLSEGARWLIGLVRADVDHPFRIVENRVDPLACNTSSGRRTVIVVNRKGWRRVVIEKRRCSTVDIGLARHPGTLILKLKTEEDRLESRVFKDQCRNLLERDLPACRPTNPTHLLTFPHASWQP